MGNSFSRVEPEKEPDGGALNHHLSGRRYEATRRATELVHRELQLPDAVIDPTSRDHDTTQLLTEVTCQWRVGSGRHARTYLAEIDGFLVESPLTWYESKRTWGMSPGYDAKRHDGFSRPVNSGCLNCHAGLVEEIDGSIQRVNVIEACISCERCHGPGSLHVDARKSEAASNQSNHGPDYTIVNPRHLTRELADDVCAQCHHMPTVVVDAPRRGRWQFRPGLPLAAFRVDYQVQRPGSHSSMTVVGHSGQVRQSACYQRSEMTCTTCHNPHRTLAPEERINHYRAVCVSCHTETGCTVDPALRHHTSTADSCIACHMPESATEVAHVAFTHHRIGIHDKSPQASTKKPVAPFDEHFSPGEIVAVSDPSWLSKSEQLAAHAVAVMRVGKELRDPQQREAFGRSAFNELRLAWDGGVRDSRMISHLALLAQSFAPLDVPKYARPVLADETSTPAARTDALLALAGYHAMRSEFAPALSSAEQLTELRREASDHVLLGQLQLQTGNTRAAIASLERAIEIDSMLHPVRRRLIDHYQRIGDTLRVIHHQSQLPPARQAPGASTSFQNEPEQRVRGNDSTLAR